MRARLNVKEVEDRLEALKSKMDEKKHIVDEQLKKDLDGQKKYVIFLSVGNPEIRARVIKACSNQYEAAWKKAKRSLLSLVQKRYIDPQWIKADIVSNIEKWDYFSLENYLEKVKRNYFRKGLAFDDEFRLAFLEQEINGYAMIRRTNDGPQSLDEKNINNYLQYNGGIHTIFSKRLYQNKTIYSFKTLGFFDENGEVYELYNGELTNGIRKVERLDTEIYQLIKQSTHFLASQIKENGQFAYGYFPCFSKKIKTYNILRHASTLYAMAEGYELLRDQNILRAIEGGIRYLIDHSIVYYDDRAYVVDVANDSEIKLGSNAHAILALTKLMEVTGSDQYLDIVRDLGKAILWMQKDDGGFLHVWDYPSFALKDAFRTVYYDGEAVFALLRLYGLDRQNQWLEAVKKSFDYLIEHDYWQYHDHWLSYAANELTMYAPEDQYFMFGLKNCQGKLNFIYHRNTTYPTFLELTMAAFKMVKKIEELNKHELLQYIDTEFLLQTIDKRAEYQRVGFCYPEIAMYFKRPALVLHGFFIRHQAFRVRIDDIEHNLSGYCHYLMYRVPEWGETENFTLTNI